MFKKIAFTFALIIAAAVAFATNTSSTGTPTTVNILPYKPYYEDLTFGHAWSMGSQHYNAQSVSGQPFDQDFLLGGFGASVDVGKMFNPQWGVEVGYTYFNGGNFNHLRLDGMTDVNLTLMNSALDVAAKRVWQLGQSSTSVFAKLGPALVFSSSVKTINAEIIDKTRLAAAVYASLGMNHSLENGAWNFSEQVSAVSNSAASAIAPGLQNRPGLWMVSFGVGYAFQPV